jgi:hypothetical protein
MQSVIRSMTKVDFQSKNGENITISAVINFPQVTDTAFIDVLWHIVELRMIRALMIGFCLLSRRSLSISTST